VREADASAVTSFGDALPADVLLLCGIFGNVSAEDIRRTVGAAPAMCKPGATVIWTRHRRPPDLTPQIRAWFAEGGFDELAFDALGTGTLTGVGVNRLGLASTARLPDQPLFTFRPQPPARPGERPRHSSGTPMTPRSVARPRLRSSPAPPPPAQAGCP
jgi:hypothetical protein